MKSVVSFSEGEEVVLQGFSSIKKRNGIQVDFKPEKITNAILRAGKETGEFEKDAAQLLMMNVLNVAAERSGSAFPTVEGIQDIVEEVLFRSVYKKTAKAYILYRDQRTRIREIGKDTNINMVDGYLDRLDWKVKENSNMDYSLQGMHNHVVQEVTKNYWLNKLYTPEIRSAHVSGDLHIHDLGTLSVYCVGWDLKDLLMVGFSGVFGKPESKPPKHLGTALGQIANFFYTLQGEAAGAQAFSSFDTLLAPFIRYDNLSYKQVKQAMQEFIYNVNVPTRVGFQTPFTNITLDLQPPSTLKNEPVIYGGKLQKETYSEFGKEMSMINRAFLEVMEEGDAKGRIFAFPIPTYNVEADFDWDNPEFKPLWAATAKYGLPYFANFINSDLSADDARSMCCRLRLDNRELIKRGGGLFGSNPLTGSIGVVTINMPRIGYLAKTEEDFFKRLDHLMEISRVSLEHKRKILEKFTDQGLYPYSKFYLRQLKEAKNLFWFNHFSTIGLVGLNEAVVGFLGKDLTTDIGKAFGEKVLHHMRNKLVTFQEMTGNFYNLEATPGEGTTYRLARLDKEHYPEIQSASDKEGSGVAPFYTNSSQLPVDYTTDIFKTLDLQDELQSLYTGGTVQHVFVGESVADPEAVKEFVKKVCNNYKLPYFTVTPTFSICPTHGYLRGEHEKCTTCGKGTEIYSRVVGFYTPVHRWNDGKQQEFGMRSMNKVEECVESKGRTECLSQV
jgi:ribonucleoside-triphosphate reductase (formate)